MHLEILPAYRDTFCKTVQADRSDDWSHIFRTPCVASPELEQSMTSLLRSYLPSLSFPSMNTMGPVRTKPPPKEGAEVMFLLFCLHHRNPLHRRETKPIEILVMRCGCLHAYMVPLILNCTRPAYLVPVGRRAQAGPTKQWVSEHVSRDTHWFLRTALNQKNHCEQRRAKGVPIRSRSALCGLSEPLFALRNYPRE